MNATNSLMDPFKNNKLLKNTIKRILPVLVIIVIILYLASLNKYWKPEWDSAYFIICAKSISEGKGFTYLGYPCLKATIGFPFLLSIINQIFGLNFLILNILMVIFAFIAILGIYFLFCQSFSKEYAFIIGFFSGLSFLMLFHTNYIMTDVPYMASSMFALLFMHKFVHNKNSYVNGILAAVFIVISFLIRSIGIALLACVIFYIAFRGTKLFASKKAITMLLIIIIPIGASIIRDRTIPVNYKDPILQLHEFMPSQIEIKRFEYDEPSTKITGYFDVVKRALKNATYYAGTTSCVISGYEFDTSMKNIKTFPIALIAVLLGLSLITALGFVRSVYERKYICDFYILFYFGVLLVWSARETRYLVPVLPFLIHYFMVGLAWVGERIGKLITLRRSMISLHTFVFSIFICYFAIANIYKDVQIVEAQRREPYYSQNDQNFFSAISWVKENTSKDSKIVSVKAPYVVLFAERWCVSFPWVEDNVSILKMFKYVKADYLIVSPQHHNEQRFLLPLVERYSSLFYPQCTSGEAIVYKIDKNKIGAHLE